MTTAAARPRSPNGQLATAPLRRRRQSRVVLLAIVLGVIGALIGFGLYRFADSRISIVAVARPVAVGATLTHGDVREILVPAATGLTTVSWADVDSVIGRVAATDLLAGQSLTPDATTTERQPAAGFAVVGIAVGPGRVPATPLSARDEVLVVGLATPSTQQRATVLRAGEPDAAGKRTIDLLVAEGSASALAQAAAGDQAVVVLLARR